MSSVATQETLMDRLRRMDVDELRRSYNDDQLNRIERFVAAQLKDWKLGNTAYSSTHQVRCSLIVSRVQEARTLTL